MPYDPNLATPDVMAKLALFWEWVAAGLPGWPKRKQDLVRGQQRSCRCAAASCVAGCRLLAGLQVSGLLGALIMPHMQL